MALILETLTFSEVKKGNENGFSTPRIRLGATHSGLVGQGGKCKGKRQRIGERKREIYNQGRVKCIDLQPVSRLVVLDGGEEVFLEYDYGELSSSLMVWYLLVVLVIVETID